MHYRLYDIKYSWHLNLFNPCQCGLSESLISQKLLSRNLRRLTAGMFWFLGVWITVWVGGEEMGVNPLLLEEWSFGPTVGCIEKLFFFNILLAYVP